MEPPFPALRMIVTLGCNLDCQFCHHEGVKAGTEVGPIGLFRRIARTAASVGLRKICLTGGEPTLRMDLPELVRNVSSHWSGELSLTTNGICFPALAADLASSGMRSVNISLPGFAQGMAVRKLLSSKARNAIDAAHQHGLKVKLNLVVTRACSIEDVRAAIEEGVNAGCDVEFLGLVWTPDLDSYWKKNAVGMQFVAEELMRRALTVRISVCSAPYMEFALSEVPSVKLRAPELSKLLCYPICKGCPDRVKCCEGLYAIRVDGSGRVYPCLIGRHAVHIKPSADVVDQVTVVNRLLDKIVGSIVSVDELVESPHFTEIGVAIGESIPTGQARAEKLLGLISSF